MPRFLLIAVRHAAMAMALQILCAPPAVHAASALSELVAACQSSARLDLGKVTAAYNETMLRREGIQRAVMRLRALASSAALHAAGRSNVYLAVAHLQWRDGDRIAALASVDQALEGREGADAFLLKARLLDAGADPQAARVWYRRAQSADISENERWLIRMRLAIMEISGADVGALEQLAAQREQVARNGAAVVLALQGHPERAIALYEPHKETGRMFRQHLRLADWAIRAGAAELARLEAWRAYRSAPSPADARYALALLAESYRDAGQLDGLLADLAERGASDDELLRLRVDTLIETRQYQKAGELYRQLEGAAENMDARRRLVSLYAAAGDTQAMVREYRRLMKAEPGQSLWYEELAAHYVNVADKEAARRVWATLEERNAGRPEVLLEAARRMLEMGFADQAVAMIERHMTSQGPDAEALLFLFETWLGKGREDRALEAVRRLEQFLPPGAEGFRHVADAYERLNLPGEAVRVFEELRRERGALGYDERMRLAWLYGLAGRRQDALSLWKEIWVDVESPARRSLAESQLLLLAAELGALGKIAVELERKLLHRTASRNEVSLLVQIYTEARDRLSAEEVIDDYFGYMAGGDLDGQLSAVGILDGLARPLGGDEVGRQKQLARLYGILEDYRAYGRTLRRLYEIDPQNRVEHARNIILNLLAFDRSQGTRERFMEVKAWLEELRRFDAEAVSGEFEASVYSQGGFPEKAIESSRRALVEQPGNSDNLLLLTDMMNRTGRRGEAVAILQHFAEHAVDDNGFVVAVDGLINVLGARSFRQPASPEDLKTLAWTRRMILERIATRPGSFFLYELLAEIARELGDVEGSFAAVENSLAVAGIRRPAVLRELLTRATPGEGFGGFSTGAGDPVRRIRHGRRLIGLRQHMPPEVYIGIGKALLERGDVSGAERTFELIHDITGQIDVNRVKAEAFEQKGYPELSRRHYSRALNLNPGNLELHHKTAFLHEIGGSGEAAFRSYEQALHILLRRQAAVLARTPDPFRRGEESGVTREFRDLYASLEQGLLLTWPSLESEAARAIVGFKELFERDLNGLAAGAEDAPAQLARHPRLDRTARLLRRIGFYLKDRSLLEYVDLRLLERFGEDTAFARRIAGEYAASGRAQPEGAGGEPGKGEAFSPLERQLASAAARGDFETRLQLLRLFGSGEEQAGLLHERLRAGGYNEGLGYALAFLDESDFRPLAAQAVEYLASETTGLLKLLAMNAQLLLEAEGRAGRPLVSADRFMALLDSPEGWNWVNSPPVPLDGIWEYMGARVGVDARIRYLRSLAENLQLVDDPFFLQAIHRPLHDLLREKLSRRQKLELAGAVDDFAALLDQDSSRAQRERRRAVLFTEALPGNADLLYRMADRIRERSPAEFDFRPLLEACYGQRPEELFELLVRLREHDGSLLESAFSPISSTSGFSRAVTGVAARLIEDMERGRRIDPALAGAAFEFKYGAASLVWGLPAMPFRTLQERARVLEKLAKRYPQDDGYRRALIEVWLRLGHSARAAQAVAREYSSDPQDEPWRLALFLLLRSEQRFAEAVAVARDGGTDLLDARALEDAVNRVSRLPAFRGRVAVRIADQLFRAASSYGQPGKTMPRAAGERLGATPALQRLRHALLSGEQEQGRRALREMWRATSREGRFFSAAEELMGLPLHARRDAGSRPIYSFLELTRSGSRLEHGPVLLLDAVANAPYGAAELNAYLRSMDGASRRKSHRLYELLARACRAAGGGLADARICRPRLHGADDHELTLWMLLRDSAGHGLRREDLTAFELRLSRSPDQSPYQLLLAARLFASGGDNAQAVEHYKLLAAHLIGFKERRTSDGRFLVVPESAHEFMDLSTLIEELAARLPAASARHVLETVLAIARPRAGAAAADLFDAFLLSGLDRLYPPNEVLIRAPRHSARALAPPAGFDAVGAIKAIEQARAYARAGEHRQAARLVLAMLAWLQPDSSAGAESASWDSHIAVSAKYMSRLYGLPPPGPAAAYGGGPLAELALRLDRIFPAGEQAEDWPLARKWMDFAADAAVGWLANGDVSVDRAVELLMLLAWQLREGGNEIGARGILARVHAAVAEGGTVLDSRSVASLIALAQATGGSLPFSLGAHALEEGALGVEQRVALLRWYVGTEHAQAALDIAERAGLDKGLDVIRVLSAAADRAGDEEYARELRRRLHREEQARDLVWPRHTASTQAAATLRR